MKWAHLSFQNITDIVKQTDEVVGIMKSLIAQIKEDPTGGPKGSDPRAVLLNLMNSCSGRIVQYERFYSDNDLHERAPVIEQQRLKLKRCLCEANELPPPPPPPREGSSMGPKPGFTQLKIRLTPKEFKELQTRRKALRELSRTQQSHYLEKGQGSLSWEGSTINKGHSQAMVDGSAGLYSEGPWVDPNVQPQQSPSSWVSKQNFATQLKHPQPDPGYVASQVTGSSAGPFTTSRAEVVLSRPREPRAPIDPSHRFTHVATSR
eukprot:TRINITY_DN12110_c0_g1_i1.p1 TRINITY_DN12110_c0_g1~~TRINITY_DN12110_c0_g1_i1.p1  ORF type:complete len:286 (+),score=27.79 TRINITY_DN12110_c0_g1_i1:72-860(+)